ncbi:APH(3'') family aminoglycoside O-phosphotransferase [Nocardia wallacei]|uniref:APH(3'') family aminoglycoside O-phosphotransferase n=1 Tax=Nocardia wallacei TaxID=480035 RepID=UPI0024554EB9|nr:APH(3'') family aminoglycoside O-phosphotransferase [Nocardia wallacei]
MPDIRDALHAVLPAVGKHLEWTPVTNGESGAAVVRAEDGSRYAKLVPPDRAAELRQERDRIEWLFAQGIPGPEVLDWIADDAGVCLVTSAVAGVPADAVAPAELERAWEEIARTVRRLHGLPVDACPFTRELADMFATARDVVARGAVVPEFLPVEQQRTPPEELLARLTPELELRLAQESTEAVVCHGDLCLPNIILDPATWEVAGLIDLGRLGRADPYADIALLLANARETWPDEDRARAADEEFAQFYGIDLDGDRQRYYLHLDPLTWG